MLDNFDKKNCTRYVGKLEEPFILYYAILLGAKARLCNSVCVLSQKGSVVTPKIFQNLHAKGTFSCILNGFVISQNFEILMKSCNMIYIWEPQSCVVMRAKSLPIAQSFNYVSCFQRDPGCHPEIFFKSMGKTLHFLAFSCFFLVSLIWSCPQQFLKFETTTKLSAF